MSYTTKVITDTASDFSNDPQTITESGQPASVEVTNLTANTQYYTKAEIWQNGVYQNVSNIEQFQTLQAGTITLTHQSTERSGSNYVIKFTYTTTYALSSATIKCGTAISAQGTIAGNTITFTFPATNLVDGHAYICTVDAIDIYTEQASANYGFTHHKLYQLAITGTTATSSTVECELDYIIDGTFTGGYVEWWNAGDDPSTDQPLGYETFIDGADTCTIQGLTDETTYQFRATIYYDGNVNFVQSTVVTATTIVDYDSKYFTIKNTSSADSKIQMWASATVPSEYERIYISVDDGETWTRYMPSDNIVTIATLHQGEKALIKHTGAMYPARLNISGTNAELSGNIASLCFGDNFAGTKTMPDNAYRELFSLDYATTNIQYDMSNLSFAAYTSISRFGFVSMFNNHIAQTTPPDLSGITEATYYGMAKMFKGCTSLTTPPDLSNITSVGEGGMTEMFSGCTALTTPPDLSGIRTCMGSAMLSMFKGCTSLTTPPDLSNITSVGGSGMQSMFEGCTHLATPPDMSNITTVDSSSFRSMFRNCSRLTTGPDMSGITEATYYGMTEMFYGCRALAAPPDLSGIRTCTTAGMSSMFGGCSALRKGPDLTNVYFSSGMDSMFYSCTSLTEVYAPSVSQWDGQGNWLYLASSSGTIYCLNQTVMDLIPDDSVSGCPTGWTKQLIS